MSSSDKQPSNRTVRRAIPRLKIKKSSDIDDNSDKKTSASSRISTCPGSTVQHGTDLKSGDQIKKETQLATKEGTFQQGLVGASARRAEEAKRKRQQSPAILEVKDPATKRNQARELHREKTKCQTTFNTKADTKFSSENPPAKFSAKGPASKSKSYSLADLRRQQVELHRQVEQLESQLKEAHEAKDESISQLETRLENLKEEVEKTEEEKQVLQKEMNERETYYQETLEDQKRGLLSKNDVLMKKINECQAKLQECNIDPVSLKPFTLDEDEKENITLKVKEAAEKASNLKDKLTSMIENNKDCLQTIQKITADLQKKDTPTSVIENKDSLQPDQNVTKELPEKDQVMPIQPAMTSQN